MTFLRNEVATVIKERGLTVAQISRKTGIHRNVLGRLVRNEVVEINLDVAAALCKVLNTTLDELFPYVDEMTPDDVEHANQRELAQERRRNVWKRSMAKRGD